MEDCKFCNVTASYGNYPLIANDSFDIFIVNNYLHHLEAGAITSDRVKINYCPVCGRKLK